MGRRYLQLVEGDNGWCEWIHPLKGYRLMCCDCGLVHHLQFRIVNRKRIIFRAQRDNRATAATRRKKLDMVSREKISAHITARMKTVSPSLSAAQALDDLRMAVESGDYEATP